jgi:hypothetical protein
VKNYPLKKIFFFKLIEINKKKLSIHEKNNLNDQVYNGCKTQKVLTQKYMDVTKENFLQRFN